MPTPAPPPQNDVAVIRALRAESNAGLVARDPARVTSHFAEDIHSIGGGGDLVEGRLAVTKLYEGFWKASGNLVSGVRTPGRIVVNISRARAAEPGHWRWVVNTTRGQAAYSGEYLAGWVKHGGDWRLQSELYVTTGCTGPGCGS